MHWRTWLCIVVALSLAFGAALPIEAAATATEPAPTEPSGSAAQPSGAMVAFMLVLGLVILVITWAMAIWLIRKVLSEPKNRL